MPSSAVTAWRGQARALPPPASEGPCECDLYFTCAKFVTTPEYAPRPRARREIEETLALDAAARGWDREVERHRCTSRRIEKLLADLGQPPRRTMRHARKMMTRLTHPLLTDGGQRLAYQGTRWSWPG